MPTKTVISHMLLNSTNASVQNSAMYDRANSKHITFVKNGHLLNVYIFQGHIWIVRNRCPGFHCKLLGH